MAFPWSFDKTSPNAASDKVSDYPSMTFLHKDKTTLYDMLPLASLGEEATLGWRTRQVGNVVWVVYNASHSGAAWHPDDASIRPLAIRFNIDGSMELLVGTAADPVVWSAALKVQAPAVAGGGFIIPQVWNNAGITFKALKVDVTDTASAAGSLLLDLLVGSVSKLSISKSGQVSLKDTLLAAFGDLTAVKPFVDFSAIWNNVAVTFNGLVLDITDTASAAASKLANLKVGGVSKFHVDKAGKVTAGADPVDALDLTTKQWVEAAIPKQSFFAAGTFTAGAFSSVFSAVPAATYLVEGFYHGAGWGGSSEANWTTGVLKAATVQVDLYTSSLGIWGASNTMYLRSSYVHAGGDLTVEVSEIHGAGTTVERPAIRLTRL